MSVARRDQNYKPVFHLNMAFDSLLGKTGSDFYLSRYSFRIRNEKIAEIREEIRRLLKEIWQRHVLK